MSDYRRLSGLAAGILLSCGNAAAQSSMAVYGVMDVYAGRKQFASVSGAHTTNVDNGALTTSYVGFRGNEDLGGGLTALFELTANVRVDIGDVGRFNGDPIFSRSSWAGLQGPWGTVRAGRMSSPNFMLAIRLSPFQDSTAFGPYVLHTYVGGQPLDAAIAPGGPAAASDSSYSNAVTYNSPKLNGFQGAVSYSLGEVTSSGSLNRRVSYSMVYEDGPILAGVSGEQVHRPALAPPPTVPAANQKTEQDSIQVGAAYDFGMVRVFASHNRTTIDLPVPNTRKFNTSQLGVSIPVSAGLVLLSGAKTSKRETSVIDIDRTTWSLGYDYYLSKRTDAYVITMNDRVTKMKTGISLVAGIRHRF